ncbi:MAG: hypothetical protein HC793_00600 [Aquincola sp.]|nr:hypothetical protein [Aquincola sp.]
METRIYNALNQLSRIEDAQHLAAQPTRLSPDARDQLASVQAANGATTSYERDGFDQILRETSPDRGVTAYSYDAAGNLRTQISARGVTTTHTYDALNRLASTSYTQSGQTSTEDRSYTWDANAGGPIACANGVGRLCRVVDASGTHHHAYDPFGNLTEARSLELGIDRSLRFGYDGEDRMSALTTAGNKALLGLRDNEGRVSQMRAIVNGANIQIVKTATYRGDGQADATTLGNDVVLDRSFDTSGAPSGYSEAGVQPGTGGGSQTSDEDIPTAPEWAMIILGCVLLWQLARAKKVGRTLHSAWPIGALILLAAVTHAKANESLLFDARGNIQGRTVDGVLSTYRYDRIDRLNQETGLASQSFGLDANANRTSDGAATYTVLANGNRLVTRNGVTLSYDADGNLLSDQTLLGGTTVNRSFTYTLAGQLKTVSLNGALRATYTYNHLNQRTRKVLASPAPGTPATTLYRYDTQGQLVEELAGSAASAPGISVTAGQSLVTYVWKDNTPSAVIYAAHSPGNANNPQERVVYLHTDHLETARKASNSQGQLVWSWASDAFGSTPANEDVDGNGLRTTINLRFPGQYLDAESGLHYNWNRYYDPATGRYTQSDPIGLEGGISTYLYVLGNPVSVSDPTGESPQAIATVIAAVLAAGREAIRRCASNPVCKCRAIYASYKSMCGVGCGGNTCDIVAVQARAASMCFSLRQLYITSGCDRHIPTTVDHPGAADQARRAWENCLRKKARLCCN